MGRTVSVVGLREKDEKYNEYKRIWELCKKNDIAIPEKVGEYFDWCNDLEASLHVKIKCDVGHYPGKVHYDVDINDLPEGIKKIRFVESW